MDQQRKLKYYAVLAVACLCVTAFVLYKTLFPLPARYTSVHPAQEVPQLMGFSDDSVFNVGDAAALDDLPGIGKVLSQRIVEGRETFNGYRLPTDLLLIKGIGPKTLADMMDALEEPLIPLPPATE